MSISQRYTNIVYFFNRMSLIGTFVLDQTTVTIGLSRRAVAPRANKVLWYTCNWLQLTSRHVKTQGNIDSKRAKLAKKFDDNNLGILSVDAVLIVVLKLIKLFQLLWLSMCEWGFYFMVRIGFFCYRLFTACWHIYIATETFDRSFQSFSTKFSLHCVWLKLFDAGR